MSGKAKIRKPDEDAEGEQRQDHADRSRNPFVNNINFQHDTCSESGITQSFPRVNAPSLLAG